MSKKRSDIHRDGDWHGALHIWVGGIDGDCRPFALFQRRSGSKDSWPGALDVAVGGHLRAGESLAETVREAEEEIGLVLTLDELAPLGRRFARSVRGADNEVQEVFAFHSDLPLDRYRLHPDEVEGVVSIGLDDAIALFDGSRGAVPALELRRDTGSDSGSGTGTGTGTGSGPGTPSPLDVAVSDFAAGEVGGYAVRALQGLRTLLDGGVPEPFELR